ncbi:E3 ubiquitin-protein ligase HUWE1-like [Pseudomyrmex gracilis]|uniref:E3 ubiquitin-protein ligase HUWE1-like n=1 Tax=Pseudomyrmex gracilis TaxID=219809 RepID=UPI000994E1B7|nr:E3 ubiquitin-protein ligase HUWE1-like [Pseudomyrmex gracilis]XP_020283481.1 E3 ubiquitin-protein ligase HUWE1-like [Pseudomyrmex gracilis]XP_020283482.1 E3 ubiquitin-protein ligase HUWE1-like [Pseudomyrmex gracilis]
MSVTKSDLFEKVVSKDAATKIMFMENEQYITQPFHIEENLVVGEEIVVGEDNQTDITTYFEQSLENTEIIDEESIKDAALPNNSQAQNTMFFEDVLESGDEMDIEETVEDSIVLSENCIDGKQEDSEDILSDIMKVEEDENSVVQEKEQKVILLNTSDGEQLFLFYESHSENEETDENDIESNNLHFVTQEEEEELVDDETTDSEQKTDQLDDIMHLEESLSELPHENNSEEINEQMDTKNGLIIGTCNIESFSERKNEDTEKEVTEDQTDHSKVSPSSMTYYFPGDMSYNEVSQSISLLKLKNENREEDSSKSSPSEINKSDNQQVVNEQTDLLSSTTASEVPVSTTVSDQVDQRPQGRRRPRKQKLLDRGDDEMVFVPKWKVEEEEQSVYKRRNRPRGRKKSHMAKRNIQLDKLRMKKRMRAKRRKIEIIDLTGDDNDEDKENEIITVNLASDDEKEENEEKKPVKRRRIRKRKRFTCKQCSETFMMVTALARHFKATHPQKRSRRRRTNYYQKSKTKP